MSRRPPSPWRSNWLRRGRLGPLAAAGLLAVLPVHAEELNKSGLEEGSVALPSGPGSIRGVGENVETDLLGGGISYQLELALPPSASNFIPDDFFIEYDSGGGNGILGFGWDFAPSFVSRQNEVGLPRYVDADNGIDDDLDGTIDEPSERDQFVTDSVSFPFALTQRDDGFWFASREEVFQRYAFDGDAWSAFFPEGWNLFFGSSPESRMVNPDNGKTFEWRLDREQDTNGNTILYGYRTFDGESNANNIFFESIQYAPGAPPWDAFHFVQMVYEPRTDWLENCRAGYCIRTGVRLREIIVATQGPALPGHAAGDFNNDGTTDYLNTKYVFTYYDDVPYSLLKQVTTVGADGVTALPPQTFTYSRFTAGAELDATAGALSFDNIPLALPDDANTDFNDMNGDGLPDVLKTQAATGLHTAFLNTGPVAGDPQQIAFASATTVGGDARTQSVNLGDTGLSASLTDINYDGIADLVYRADFGGTVYYYPNAPDLVNNSAAWGPRQSLVPRESEQRPPAPFSAPDVDRIDLNSDLAIDIVQAISTGNTTALRTWYNLGDENVSAPVTVATGLPYRFDQGGVSFDDFNGDDLEDFVRITPTLIEVAAGLGYGRFASVRTVTIPDTLLTPEQTDSAELNDINGDGQSDLVISRAAPGELWYWLNVGGYTLAPRQKVVNLPAQFGATAAIRFADMNGNGTDDLLFCDRFASPRLQGFDLGIAAGYAPAPNLLTRIDNGVGQVIDIEYTTSTEYQLADRAAGTPWPTLFPYVETVVRRTVTYDSLGNSYELRYSYHDGFYDATLREIAGFARGEVADIGEAAAPTQVSAFVFDVGESDFNRRGLLLSQQERDEQGNVYSETVNTYDQRSLFDSEVAGPSVFVYKTREETTITENGAGAPVTTRIDYEYDNFGNETRVSNWGVIEGDDLLARNDEVIEDTAYAINEDVWLLRLPARLFVRDGAGAPVNRIDYYYDDPTFAGETDPTTETPPVGNLTLARQYYEFDEIDPESGGGTFELSRTHYDVYGNPVMVADALATIDAGVVDESGGHFRTLEYDDVYNSFIVKETVHLEDPKAPLVLTVEHDPGLGVITGAVDFNGQRIDYGYDALGRMTSVRRPGDVEGFPSIEYDYGLGLAVAGDVVNYVETRLLDRQPNPLVDKAEQYQFSRTFYDGLGRTIMERTEAEPDNGQPRAAVFGAVLFNGRGKVSAELDPWFTATTGATLEALLSYENVDDDTWQGVFQVDGALVPRTFADAPRTQWTYDVLLRPSVRTNADGTTRRYEYEPLLQRTYDENDTDPASPYFDTPNEIIVDGQGRRVALNEITRTADDGTPLTDPVVWTTTYAWRADDLLLEIVDSQGNVRAFEYDNSGGRTFVRDPNLGSIEFALDDFGNIVERYDSKGSVIYYTYDGANRILTIDYEDEGEEWSAGYSYDPDEELSADNRPDVAIFYDEPAGEISFGDGTSDTPTNARGQIAYIWDLAGENHRSYDARGRLVAEVRVRPEETTDSPVAYATRFAYDPLDRITALTYPDGDRVTYAYTERGMLRSVAGGAGLNANGSANLLEVTDIAPSGQELRRIQGNGFVTQYAYDARGRTARLRTGPAGGATPALDYAYAFDNVASISGIFDQRTLAALPEGDARRNTQRFTYDDRYRLTGYTLSIGEASDDTRDDGVITYRYDRVGNLLEQRATIAGEARGLSVTDLGTLTYGGAGGPNDRLPEDGLGPGPNALTQAVNGSDTRDFGYDLAGNLVDVDGLSLTYDFENRLVRAEDDAMRAVYTYDYLGQRARKQVYAKDADGNIAAAPANQVEYLGRHFEIRDWGQPTKFVFDDAQRIAKATGTLDDTAPRIQRIPLLAGWNLVALGITPADTAALGEAPIELALRWDETAADFVEIGTDALAAGTVLWLNASDATVLTLVGAPGPTPDGLLTPGYNAVAALQAQRIERLLAVGVDGAWRFDAGTQSWEASLPAPLDALFENAPFLRAGEAVFVKASNPATSDLPDAARTLQHYHEDHLGSAALLTDAVGNILEETAYFPFGAIRNQFQLDVEVDNPYLFTHKERDRESGLDYFGARYLSSGLARFTSVDPAIYTEEEAIAQDPQLLNGYAYARNNPVVLEDPDGRLPQAAVRSAFSLARRFANEIQFGTTLAARDFRNNSINELGIAKGDKLSDQIDFATPLLLQAELGGALDDSKTTINDSNEVLRQVRAATDDIAAQLGKNASIKAFTAALDQLQAGGGLASSKIVAQFQANESKFGKIFDDFSTKADAFFKDNALNIDGARSDLNKLLGDGGLLTGALSRVPTVSGRLDKAIDDAFDAADDEDDSDEDASESGSDDEDDEDDSE